MRARMCFSMSMSIRTSRPALRDVVCLCRCGFASQEKKGQTKAPSAAGGADAAEAADYASDENVTVKIKTGAVAATDRATPESLKSVVAKPSAPTQSKISIKRRAPEDAPSTATTEGAPPAAEDAAAAPAPTPPPEEEAPAPVAADES